MEKKYVKNDSSSTYEVIYKTLLKIAEAQAEPYCYNCGCFAENDVCPECHSNDFLRGDKFKKIHEELAIDDLLFGLSDICMDEIEYNFKDCINDIILAVYDSSGNVYEDVAEYLEDNEIETYEDYFEYYCSVNILSNDNPTCNLNALKPVIQINGSLYRTKDVMDLIDRYEGKCLVVND